MGNMVTAKIGIRGTRPLFQNLFGPDAMPLEKQERTGVAGNDPEEWRKTCMVTKDGQMYVPGSYAFATIRDGGRYTKRNRGTIDKFIVATLQVMEERILFDRYWPGFPNGHAFDVATVKPLDREPDEPVYMDVRGVKNPNTKSQNVRYRVALSPGWQAQFTCLWDKTIVSRAEMEAVLLDAGKLVGIANGRKIGMGRFEIVSFEISDEQG